MSRKIDPDIRWLKAADKALRMTTPRMRRATLEFLWDKYVNQPIRDGLKEDHGAVEGHER